MEILSIKKYIFKSSYKKDLMLKKHKDKLNPSRNKHFTQNCPQSPMKSLYHPREAQQRIFILELVGHWNRRLDSSEEKCPLGPQMFSFRGRAPQKLCAGSRWVQSPLSLSLERAVSQFYWKSCGAKFSHFGGLLNQLRLRAGRGYSLWKFPGFLLGPPWRWVVCLRSGRRR